MVPIGQAPRPLIEFFGDVCLHILDDAIHALVCQSCEKRPGRLKALVGVAVAIGDLADSDRTLEEPIDHQAREIQFFENTLSQMREIFFFKDALEIQELHVGVERIVVVLDVLRDIQLSLGFGRILAGVHQRGIQHLDHLLVILRAIVVDDVMERLSVRETPERLEECEDRDLFSQVRDRDNQLRVFEALVGHLDAHRLDVGKPRLIGGTNL